MRLPTFVTSFILLIATHYTSASWGTPGVGQYHIQTDEGPERFFRFQTDSGQYRKEKRLKDGTVIGTEAWIDAIGYLRQKDYIADHQGFRILKSKTVYVGRNRPVEEAIRSLKKVPAQAGTLAKTQSHPDFSTNQFTAEKSTTISPPVSNNYITNENAQSSFTDDDKFYTPSNVFIKTHSNYGSDTYKPTNIPINYPSQPFHQTINNALEPIAVYAPSSTPSPITADLAAPTALYPSSTPLPATTTPKHDVITSISSTAIPETFDYNYPTSTETPKLANVVNRKLLPPYSISQESSEDFYSPTEFTPIGVASTPKPITSLRENNIEVQPLYSRSRARSQPTPYQYYDPSRSQQYNNVGNGYDPQYPLYDGVSITDNGFRYYLPRQYHEEENVGAQRRDGSFGYIDPFGIRRVIYYNSGPGQGFVVRKNNRYVGFNATPYDPRPL